MRNNYPLTAITLESDCAAHHFIAFSVFSVLSVLLNLNSAAPSALQSTAGIKNLSKPQRQLFARAIPNSSRQTHGVSHDAPILSDRSDRSDGSDLSVTPTQHAYPRNHQVASKPQGLLLHAQPTAATNGSSLPRFFRKSKGGFPHLFKQTR